MTGAAARNDLELRMMETMVDCAYGLGMGFGKAAQSEADFERQMTLTDAFQRCFHAVRMGIRLSLTLRSAPKPAAEPADREVEREPIKDRPERDRERDYDRDRDYEPVSLDRFLAALRGVTRDAQRLQVGDPVPLQRLLAEADAEAPAPARKARTAPSPTKARYFGSAVSLAPISAHPRESGDPGFFR